MLRLLAPYDPDQLTAVSDCFFYDAFQSAVAPRCLPCHLAALPQLVHRCARWAARRGAARWAGQRSQGRRAQQPLLPQPRPASAAACCAAAATAAC